MLLCDEKQETRFFFALIGLRETVERKLWISTSGLGSAKESEMTKRVFLNIGIELNGYLLMVERELLQIQ